MIEYLTYVCRLGSLELNTQQMEVKWSNIPPQLSGLSPRNDLMWEKQLLW